MTWARVSRPPVLRGVRLDQSSVLDASAGTGKTYALENLVTELVLSTTVDFERLLIVTFTERATAELRQRVRRKLEALQAGREPATEADIRAGDFWSLDVAASARIARALHAFDGATITTIHAFCQRVLREHAFASGRLFEEQHVDGRDAFAKALKRGLRTLASDPVRGPWLETALQNGGSVARLEELLWNCVEARGELRPRFDGPALTAALSAWPVVGVGADDLGRELRACRVHGSTIKAIISRIAPLGQAVEAALASPSLASYLVKADELKLRDLLSQLSGVTLRPGPAARTCAAALELAAVTPPFLGALAQMLLPIVTADLDRTKRETGRYDFDDMLSLVDDALRGPRGHALAASMRRRWKYAFIDEFQDTDETQWSIFRRAFFEGGDAASRSFVLLIGDPKQSIYRFRGADVSTYLKARSAVVDSGGQRLALDRSYRATEALVGATNAIFDQEVETPVFTGDVKYVPVGCGRPERKLVDGEGRPVAAVHLLRFERHVSLPAFASVIAREVKQMTKPGRPWRLDGRALEPRDAFVLTRTSKDGRTIGETLRELGVAHAFYKEDGLYQSDEATDLAILLAAIEDPGDRAKRLSAWLTPFFGLPLSAVERTRDLSTAHPLVARLLGWKALADARAFDRLFESILRESGIVRREIFFGRGKRAVTNLQHLVELCTERAREGHKSLDDLLTELAALKASVRPIGDIEGNVQRMEADVSAVQIMTIHKAKGLEAPVVFVACGSSPGRPSDVRVYDDGGQRLAWVGRLSADVEPLVKQAEQEEEERLMYVALTRAMARLVLPCVVADGGPKAPQGPYRHVNGRIFEVGHADGTTWTSEDVAPAARVPAPFCRAETTWRPPLGLLADAAPRPNYGALRVSRAGAFAMSYTRMKADRQSGPTGAGLGDPRLQQAERAGAEVSSSTLRASRGSGVFLHELLERLPLASFSAGVTFDVWRTKPEVDALVTEAMAAHRVERAQRGHAERLVWAAYTTPVDLPGGDKIGSLASAPRVVREMRYVFPLFDAKSRPAAYVRGSLDLVLEHRGRAYFVDWKSDSLASYAPASLGAHVAEHYREQLELYALAVVKLLGVGGEGDYQARFGGVIYSFLRGLEATGRGHWSTRPSWADVLRWSEGLRARPLARRERAP